MLHYFETVDHRVLLEILGALIKDDLVLWLVKVILENYASGVPGKGMPLGNWTSQFFANVYLNELDQFVKHALKAGFYIRYVDDFVILHRSRKQLAEWKDAIDVFLRERLLLELHPNKSAIIALRSGVCFLGFRVFYQYKLVRVRNLRKIRKRQRKLCQQYALGSASAGRVLCSLQGWCAYASQANTYNLRKKLEEEVHQRLAVKGRNVKQLF